jgi:glycogen debranching enzyme
MRPRARVALLCIAGLVIAAMAALVARRARSGREARAPGDRPRLFLSNPAAQSELGMAYANALRNLLDVNTVPCDPSYNSTGLITGAPQLFVRAGGGYPGPWTRDASVNSWNAASLLEPEIARNTLWSVVHKEDDGGLIVDQDNQWWDQVVWIPAAWNHYLVTGDAAFLQAAYPTAVRTLARRKETSYAASYGLFRGPGFFNDGIAGYPAPPADATESRGAFVLDYPGADRLLVLSTNALYYEAHRSAAQMAAALGHPAAEAAALGAMADSLKTRINEAFWIPSRSTYGYLIHDGDDLSGTLAPSAEATGLSFVILFGIADEARARSVIEHAHVHPYGIVDVYPHFARYTDSRPGRHNGVVWPMAEGFFAQAAAKVGDSAAFSREVSNLARLANRNGRFNEIYNALTGAEDGGWQTQEQWKSEPDQTWSATAFLRMIYQGVFGMRFTASALELQPLLPPGWDDARIQGIRYRGMTLDIELRGEGNFVRAFELDGRPVPSHQIPAELTGPHAVVVALAPRGY